LLALCRSLINAGGGVAVGLSLPTVADRSSSGVHEPSSSLMLQPRQWQPHTLPVLGVTGCSLGRASSSSLQRSRVGFSAQQTATFNNSTDQFLDEVSLSAF